MLAETNQPIVRALERANIQIQRLMAKLREATSRAETAEAELARWKRRCYPTRADIVQAGIEPEHAAGWLDRNTCRVVGGWLPSGDADKSDRFDIWREGDDYPTEIAEAIRWAADGLNLDQWAVLEEMTLAAADRSSDRAAETAAPSGMTWRVG